MRQIKHCRLYRTYTLDFVQPIFLFFCACHFLLKNLMALLSNYILNVVRLRKVALTIVLGLPPLPENLDRYYQI